MRVKYLKGIGQISYPVGEYIAEAIEFVNAVLTVLTKDKTFPTSNIAIWCRGSSGAILASLLSHGLIVKGYRNISVNHVKKPNENSHSFNCFLPRTTNIIIDDFTCTGDTINHIANWMKEYTYSIDYMIFSGVALNSYPADYEDESLAGTVKGLYFPVPHNLLVPAHHNLKRNKRFLESLKVTNLSNWTWEPEQE